MSILSKTRQKRQSQKQGRARNTEQNQLDLFARKTYSDQKKNLAKASQSKPKPDTAALPEHPLATELDTKSSDYWKRNRYRFNCAHTGREIGFPFFSHEVEYILAQFNGRQSPVSLAEFGEVAEVAVKPATYQKAVAS